MTSTGTSIATAPFPSGAQGWQGDHGTPWQFVAVNLQDPRLIGDLCASGTSLTLQSPIPTVARPATQAAAAAAAAWYILAMMTRDLLKGAT